MQPRRRKGEERWAARSVVAMLIRLKKDYNTAAEIVSGSKNVFLSHRREVEEKIDQITQTPSAVSALALQQALDNARDEIAEHLIWQKEVLDYLPRKDDEAGLTETLRQAFADSAKERSKLLDFISAAYDKYFYGQIAPIDP